MEIGSKLGIFKTEIIMQNINLRVEFHVVAYKYIILVNVIGRDVIMRPEIKTIVQNGIKMYDVNRRYL